MKILVTGGAGFIASHLVDRMVQDNHQVVVVDNLSNGNLKNLNPLAKFYDLDIRHPKLKDIFALEKPEFVFHHAAQINFQSERPEPVLNGEVNIIGTLNLLKNCRLQNVGKIIFASSAAVYGDSRYLPVDERHPTVPVSFAGISKLAAEHYIRVYNQLYGLKYSIFRYSNVYGPRQFNKGKGGVVAKFIYNLLSGDRPCVFGDGSQSRDFVHVNDVVEANMLAIKGGDDEIFNINSGTKTTVKELTYMLNCLTDLNVKPSYKASSTYEILHSQLDNSKARYLLGWNPVYSLKEGLAETIDFYRRNKVVKVSDEVKESCH